MSRCVRRGSGERRAAMARRILPPPATTKRATAMIDRALYLGLREASVELRDQFVQFARRTDLLEDQARMANIESEPVAASLEAFDAIEETNGHLAETMKQDEDLPPAALRAVERSLSRAERLWQEFELKLRASILSNTIRAFEAGAAGPFRQIGFKGSFDLRNPKVLDYLSTRANMLAGGVSDTTFDAIRNTITRGFYVDGKNPIEVARDLRGQFDFLSGPRSRNIARTETGIASEQGLYEQHYSIGVESKMWISIGDNLTRESHLAVNRTVVPIFDTFKVRSNSGIDEMLHPLDPTASPENICQCRCGSGAVIETSEISEPWTGD